MLVEWIFVPLTASAFEGKDINFEIVIIYLTHFAFSYVQSSIKTAYTRTLDIAIALLQSVASNRIVPGNELFHEFPYLSLILFVYIFFLVGRDTEERA